MGTETDEAGKVQDKSSGTEQQTSELTKLEELKKFIDDDRSSDGRAQRVRADNLAQENANLKTALQGMQGKADEVALLQKQIDYLEDAAASGDVEATDNVQKKRELRKLETDLLGAWGKLERAKADHQKYIDTIQETEKNIKIGVIVSEYKLDDAEKAEALKLAGDDAGWEERLQNIAKLMKAKTPMVLDSGTGGGAPTDMSHLSTEQKISEVLGRKASRR